MAGTLGYGTGLTWGGTTVGNLNSIGGVSLSADSIDVTTHQSANSYKEFIQGMIDAGEFPIAGNFLSSDTGQNAMLTDFNARTSREVVVTAPGSAWAWTFTGFVTAFNIGEATTSDAVPFSASVKITGKPVLAISTSTGMSALAISNSAVIAPTFAIGTLTYVATVLTGVTSVTVTPTAASHTIVVTANGASQTVATGQASSAITLGGAGSITPITIAVTESGKATKTYTVTIYRA